jgi:hypothetical protein
VIARLDQLYPSANRPVSGSLSEVCRDLPIDVLVAKDTDAVWSSAGSWVWTEKPVFSDAYIRLFGCHGIAERSLHER